MVPSSIIEFEKLTKGVKMYLFVSMMLIILFIISPLKNNRAFLVLGKIVIVCLLGYTIYLNISQTNNFYKNTNTSFGTAKWDVSKTNILFSYILSVFLLILIVVVLRF